MPAPRKIIMDPGKRKEASVDIYWLMSSLPVGARVVRSSDVVFKDGKRYARVVLLLPTNEEVEVNEQVDYHEPTITRGEPDF